MAATCRARFCSLTSLAVRKEGGFMHEQLLSDAAARPIPITPLILTYNEEANIDRVLQKLTWADEVVVIDSFSSDKTLEIISRYPRVRVVQRAFDHFADQ